MNAGQIINVFDRCFGERYLIRLCGGAEEPLYLPAVGEQPAQLFFRADYAASALHEAAHWCLAGAKRRRLVDFGYEYLPPPRNKAEQRVFYQAELRTQSLEYFLAGAAGVCFTISTDNFNDDGMLDLDTLDEQRLFSQQLLEQHHATKAWLNTYPGARARQFMQALECARG